MTEQFVGHRPFDPKYEVGPHNTRCPYIVRATDWELFPGNFENLLADSAYRFITVAEWDYIRQHGVEVWQKAMRERFSPVPHAPMQRREALPDRPPPGADEITGTIIAPDHVLARAGGQVTMDAALGRIPAGQPNTVTYADGRPDGVVGGTTPQAEPGVTLADVLGAVDLMSSAELEVALVEHQVTIRANAGEPARRAALKQALTRAYSEAADAAEAAANGKAA